ncbi:unnamed protein product [Linum trigynum]|uniref:Uncharacterized protein n=1 Tax=Linum trigynum TaxID=586398 RepID=A0AAV2CMM1_9ROSI
MIQWRFSLPHSNELEDDDSTPPSFAGSKIVPSRHPIAGPFAGLVNFNRFNPSAPFGVGTIPGSQVQVKTEISVPWSRIESERLKNIEDQSDYGDKIDSLGDGFCGSLQNSAEAVIASTIPLPTTTGMGSIGRIGSAAVQRWQTGIRLRGESRERFSEVFTDLLGGISGRLTRFCEIQSNTCSFIVQWHGLSGIILGWNTWERVCLGILFLCFSNVCWV